MKFSELKKSTATGACPIYYVEGEDAFLRESSLNILKRAFLLEPDFNLNNFLGSDLKQDLEVFLTAVRSYPFMSDKRFVVVREYYPTAQELKNKNLSAVFNQVEETTVLIFINQNKCEALKKQPNVTFVDCSKLDAISIIKYVKNEALKNNIVVDNGAINKLIEYTSYDMTKISVELSKLISYVGDNGYIDEDSVESVIVKDTEYEVYELTEQIANLNYDKALETLNEMLNKNTDKQRLFISIYYHFRRLLHASLSQCSDYELAQILSVKEFAVKKARIQCKKFTSKRLKAICDKLAYYDTAFKSGELSVDTVLWNTVFSALIS